MAGREIISLFADAKRKRQALAMLFSVLFLAFVIGLGLKGKRAAPPSHGQPGVVSSTYPLPDETRAPAGEIITGFPKEFIVENNVQVQSSMVDSYASTGQKTFSVIYTSKKSMRSAFDAYKQYFANSAWEITNSSDLASHMFLFASSIDGDRQVNVDITKNNDQTMVRVSVLQQ